MALKPNAQAIKQGYVDACNAVLTRGGNVTSGAPIGDLSKSILAIPHDQTLTYHTGVGTKMQVTVPQSVEKYALVDNVGGMTYKSENLLKPSSFIASGTYSGLSVTVNKDGSITLNGTPTTDVVLYNDTDIYFVGEDLNISVGTQVNGIVLMFYEYYGMEGYEFDIVGRGFAGASDIHFSNGKEMSLIAIAETNFSVTIYPMLVKGANPKTYKPYFNGLRATKTTELVSDGKNGNLLDTLTMPEYVRNIDGYGDGVNEECYNYVDFKRKVFVQNTYRKVFNGTENILDGGLNAKGQTKYSFYLVNTAKDSMRELLCVANHYTNGTVADTYSNSGNIISTNENYIRWIDTEFPIYSLTDMQVKLKSWYDEGNPLIVEYILATPIEIDISAYLTDEGIIVEGGGTITAVNEHSQDLPTEITYLINTTGGG